MPRNRTTIFTTIRTEGGLLPADLLAGVASLDKNIPGLAPGDYHLAKGESLTNTIAESWAKLRLVWKAFVDALGALPKDDPGTTLTRERWLLRLFSELGYGRLQTAKAAEIDGKTFPVSHEWANVPIHLVSARFPLDRRTAGVKGAAGASPHGLVQDYLNRSNDHLWAFVSNGLELRILRDNASLTRQAHVEFDLETMFADEVFDDFVVLWLTCHQSRVEADNPAECRLEQWTKVAAEAGTRARDDLRGGVEAAIEALGAGFVAHPANTALKERLRTGDLTTHDYYRQLLRLIYRLLFLFVAEDRNLLHPPAANDEQRRRYARYYSLARIRALAGRRRGGPHPDLWESLVVVFTGLGRPDGIPALGLPALGSFLWSHAACPDLDTARIANQALLTAVRGVGFVEDAAEKVLRPVDYRNLGSEELGAIYESLLEQHPVVNADAGTFTLNTAAGNERKTTGSYYTPTSLITELLDSAVDPVVSEAAAKSNPEAAILDLKVIDPACGSGHFLIAAAHRIAKRLAAIRTGDDEPSPDATRTALRDVIARCIHGIDLNPMAVELCKVSLWMESMEPGKPLGFLDHRIVRGNGLIGATPALLDAGVPDDAFKQLTGDDKAVITSLKTRNKNARTGQGNLFGTANAIDITSIAGAVGAIDAAPDTDLHAVQAKAARWNELVESADYQAAVHAADTWCATFVAPKTTTDPGITHEDYATARDTPASVAPQVRSVVQRLADQYAFLHWHLAFPDVYATRGRFDIILGNPPWERLAMEDSQFFAVRAPELLSVGTTAKRKAAIRKRLDQDPVLRSAYEHELRLIEGLRHFVSSSGRFPYGASGRLNTFALFADAARDEAERGASVGLVLPSAILTDVPFQGFIERLLDQSILKSFFDFENSLPIFVGVDSRFRFSLLALGRSGGSKEFMVAFGLREPTELRQPGRTYEMSVDDLDRINPSTHQLPSCVSVRDFELLRDLHGRCPRFAGPSHPLEARAWVALTSEANSSDFADQPAEGLLPVFEAKMIHQFDPCFATYEGVGAEERRAGSPRPAADLSESGLATPRYWVPESVWSRWANSKTESGFYIGLRDITNSTNERTAIAAVLGDVAAVQPLNGVSVPGTPEHLLIVVGAINSFALDYVARLKILGTHLNVTTFSQLPAPPDPVGWLRTLIVSHTAELSGVEIAGEGSTATLRNRQPGTGSRQGERRHALRAELDAAFFHLYGIGRGDVDYIMDTFPIVRRKDEAAHGEYRTKRLILERYDALAEAAASGAEYQTVLDPPPADPNCAHPASTRPEWA